MIAPGVLVQLGRPAKFTHAHHERVLESAALVHVVDQRGESLIELRQLLVQVFKNLRVMVPPGIVHRHKAHARFHQSSREQTTLAELMPSVSVPQFFRFLADVERGLSI